MVISEKKKKKCCYQFVTVVLLLCIFSKKEILIFFFFFQTGIMPKNEIKDLLWVIMCDEKISVAHAIFQAL